jgi:hypothetical protein
MEKFLWIVLAAASVPELATCFGLDDARLGTGFPWGTLAVNVLGSATLAFLLQLASGSSSFSPTLRLALTTGFLGGFTTSTDLQSGHAGRLAARGARLGRADRARDARSVPRAGLAGQALARDGRGLLGRLSWSPP